MIGMRRAGWAIASAALLLAALGCGAVAVLLFGYMAGPSELHDGTCIGGQTGWAWLQLAFAAAACVAPAAGAVLALRGRPPVRVLVAGAILLLGWLVLVVWAIPDASGPAC